MTTLTDVLCCLPVFLLWFGPMLATVGFATYWWSHPGDAPEHPAPHGPMTPI